MEVSVRCFAGLSKKHDCDFNEDTRIDLTEGATISNLLVLAGVPESEVKTIFVNGKIVRANRPLREGDRVALMPATGGM